MRFQNMKATFLFFLIAFTIWLKKQGDTCKSDSETDPERLALNAIKTKNGLEDNVDESDGDDVFFVPGGAFITPFNKDQKNVAKQKHNEYRKEKGKGTLSDVIWKTRLAEFAAKQAVKCPMHWPPGFQRMHENIELDGYHYPTLGENLLDGRNFEDVFERWKKIKPEEADESDRSDRQICHPETKQIGCVRAECPTKQLFITPLEIVYFHIHCVYAAGGNWKNLRPLGKPKSDDEQTLPSPVQSLMDARDGLEDTDDESNAEDNFEIINEEQDAPVRAKFGEIDKEKILQMHNDYRKNEAEAPALIWKQRLMKFVANKAVAVCHRQHHSWSRGDSEITVYRGVAIDRVYYNTIGVNHYVGKIFDAFTEWTRVNTRPISKQVSSPKTLQIGCIEAKCVGAKTHVYCAYSAAPKREGCCQHHNYRHDRDHHH